jgi:hypothetical protein
LQVTIDEESVSYGRLLDTASLQLGDNCRQRLLQRLREAVVSLIASEGGWETAETPCMLSAVVLQNSRHPLAGPAKRKHRLGFITSQSKIKDVKAVPHVGAVCCASERQHPELDSKTKYYLRNCLVVVTGDLSHTWFQENLAVSGE